MTRAFRVGVGLLAAVLAFSAHSEGVSMWMESLRTRGTLVGRAGDSILIYRTP